MTTYSLLQAKYYAPPPASDFAGDFERSQLVESHLPKVRYIADRIAAKLPPSVERDDLYGAGVIGLIEAADRFDPARGIAFTTFAELRVRGAILDSLREIDWASRAARRRSREVQNAYTQIEEQIGRPATEEEVAARLKMSLRDLHETLAEMQGLNFADLNQKDSESGLDILESIQDSADSPLEQYQKEEQREHLSQAIDKLPERERQIIALYYLEELTLKEIGEILGITEGRVSQLRSQAITRLRGNIQSKRK